MFCCCEGQEIFWNKWIHLHCTFKTVTDCKSLLLPADIVSSVPVHTSMDVTVVFMMCLLFQFAMYTVDADVFCVGSWALAYTFLVWKAFYFWKRMDHPNCSIDWVLRWNIWEGIRGKNVCTPFQHCADNISLVPSQICWPFWMLKIDVISWEETCSSTFACLKLSS